ncbi:hypothetical protein PNA2_1394 [Pyrococcus sp. NA2]|uniref:hypothetical protein n=1 Tax=Pyrococcus sp. (strain NA2) TaxID=342949 RepID=UPI000209AEA7|nr:hypothetical protein [Pyrococcus sp. NA2]AEC52309.1 hypothetical protein PNA2_1394 [Pyrococcus sp. NA2]
MNHEFIKREIKNILQFYGFTAREEAPAMIHDKSGVGRVDVVGYKDGVSIGVEVVESGDVARDAKKLAVNNYTYKYIVVLEHSKKVGEIIVDGQKIKVLDPESFEHELRRDLGIPPTHPYYSFTKIPEVYKPLRSGKLEELLEELEESGLENFADDVIKYLAIIYIPGRLPVKVSYPATKSIGQEYKSVNVPPQILSILTKFNLVDTYGEGSGYYRKWFAYPTKKGEEIAHEIILRRIEENRHILGDMIHQHGEKIWIVLQGSVDYVAGWIGARYPIESIKPPIGDLRQSKHEEDIVDIAEHSRLPGWGIPGILPQQVRYVPDLIALFCNFLARSALRDFALQFFGELEHLGLAVQEYSYTSAGEAFELDYFAPKEIVDFFLARTKPPANLSYYAQRFGAYYVLIEVGQIVHPPTARQKYEKLMRTLELPEEIVAEVLSDMNKRGITSKLITKKDKAPFIILDEKSFREYLKFGLSTIVNYFR